MGVPIWGDFEWASVFGMDDADALTTGKLRLYVDGLQVWGSGYEGADWVWRELLAGLSQSWDRLLFEGWIEGPSRGGGRPGAREALVRHALARVAHGDADQEWLEALDERAFEWEQAHELSRFLPGIALPEVFIFATTEGVEFATVHASVVVSLADADAALSALGDQIARRLDGSGDALALDLARSWNDRRGPATDSLASARVGIPQDTLRYARGAMSEAEAWGDMGGTMGWTPYLAVAQACRQLGRHTMAVAMASVAGLPDDTEWLGATASLEEVVRLTGAWMPAAAEPLVARELRGLAGVGPAGAVPLLHVAASLGIVVAEVSLDEVGFPGLAVHSPGRAPLLLLNARGFGASDEAARRFAFAVGMCSLLDAQGDGTVTAFVLEAGEPDRSRHRIALELLLPQASLEEAVLEDPTAGTLDRICARFGVDFAIVALQVRAGRVLGALAPSDQVAVAATATEPVARPSRRRVKATYLSVA